MKRIASYLLLLSFALAFTACREKEQPTVAQMKGVFYAGAPGLEEVIEIVPGKSKTVDLQAYADQVSDIVLNLTLKVDPDGAAAYNGAHGTDYPMCPGSAYEFTTNKVLMPRYGKASTSAKLKLTASGLEEDVVYVVPVNIDEVIGTDNWERSSSPYAYVLVKRAYVAPDAGTGTKNDPYNIYNTADLLKMSELLVPGTKIYFRLKADIDMTGIDWVPLNFASPYENLIDFDGNGHTISNFTSTFANYPSFFGVLYGSCHDVTFTNAVIESAVGGATGIIASYCGTTNMPGEAHRVHVQGRVTSPGGNKNGTGGLFGRIWGANITACSADVEIESGEDYVGGIFGYDTGASTVSDCWTKGRVKAGSKVGGIGGGFIKADSEMYNCFSLMTVEGSFQYAGILGHANLDQKNANTTNTPNNHIEGCIAWNDEIKSHATDGAEHYSSGVIVGFTATQNYLAKCFRKADIAFSECPVNAELGYVVTNQGNAGPGAPLVVGTNTYDFAYHGLAAPADATVTSLARSLGWSDSVWDFSTPIPTLKAGTGGGGDENVNAGGQLPDYPEHDFFN
ncbi:MAG: DUF1735 domain-containing protein [Bacteroidales bacterium]|nr:DUF1735 domain-containing protein [Bacteroidales bacterium]